MRAELRETLDIMGDKLISYNKYVDFIQFPISRNREIAAFILRL